MIFRLLLACFCISGIYMLFYNVLLRVWMTQIPLYGMLPSLHWDNSVNTYRYIVNQQSSISLMILWKFFSLNVVHAKYNNFFQPEITTFASELLPLLFQYLSKASQEAEKNPRGLTKSYYALETFCENLGTNIYQECANSCKELKYCKSDMWMTQ